MGITSFSLQILDRYKSSGSVIELGAQNLYDKGYVGGNPYASEYYLRNGYKQYDCIDLNGENFAHKLDLSEQLKITNQYDVVTDFGTSEHVGKDGKFSWEAIYNCWCNKNNLLKSNGIMFNENPMTENWPGHGFNYYTEDFYRQLAEISGYKILELGKHAAMGNTTNGWNVYCVLKKSDEQPFISFEAFKKLDLRKK